MHKQHPQTAYRKYAGLIGTIFENCDRSSQPPCYLAGRLACCLRNDRLAQCSAASKTLVCSTLVASISRGVVQLLLYQLIAENAVQLPGCHGLEGAGVQQGSGLVFHIGPHIVPCSGQLRFFQIKAEKAKSYDCLKLVREG